MSQQAVKKPVKSRDIPVPFFLSLPYCLLAWSLLALGIYLLAWNLLVSFDLIPRGDFRWITTVRKNFTLLSPVTAIRWKLYLPQYVKSGRYVFIGMIAAAIVMIGIRSVGLSRFVKKYKRDK